MSQPNDPIWPHSAAGEIVNGDELLGRISSYIRRYVSLSDSQLTVVALWVVHTHLIPMLDCTPYLAITSAEKGSGKTRLLEVLDGLVYNPWLTGRVTAAVLPRKIEAEKPTLLLDESDVAFNGEKEYSEALRGVLNTGYRRKGKTSCCVGKGAETSFRDFSTFCAKAIAGIGRLPDTVADRSIPIRLERAIRGEEGVAKFRWRDVEFEVLEIKTKVEVYADQIADAVAAARPQMPDELSDRQQEATESLVAIADLAGGQWPAHVRNALVLLAKEAQTADDSTGHTLLSDIRNIFEAKGLDRISSSDLAKDLAEIESSPWAECNHGKPITPAKVSRLLKAYRIFPKCIRIEGRESRPNGYMLEDLRDAFRRYLPGHSPDKVHKSRQNDTTTNNSTSYSEIEKSDENPVVGTLFGNNPNVINGLLNVLTLGGSQRDDKPYKLDANGVGVICNACGSHFGSLGGWNYHLKGRCTPQAEAAD
jgi:hypothetical protein